MKAGKALVLKKNNILPICFKNENYVFPILVKYNVFTYSIKYFVITMHCGTFTPFIALDIKLFKHFPKAHTGKQKQKKNKSVRARVPSLL